MNFTGNASTAFLSLALASPLLTLPSYAASDHCHYTRSGDYLCINSVWGPRSNRGINFTGNNKVYNIRVNCYTRDYEDTSLIAIACWAYEAISKPPADQQISTEEVARKLSSGGGFVKPAGAIDLNRVIKNSLPTDD